MSLTIAQLNHFHAPEFVRVIGPVFEHSPWIAQHAWASRPFANVNELHHALCATVKNAGQDQQLALIRAHPDLAGKLALAGALTSASANEQASAGLSRLSPVEIEWFQNQNAAYQARFGFPFVICARLNQKAAVLAGFDRRLQNSRAQELKTALEEIFKIAELRLRDLMPD